MINNMMLIAFSMLAVAIISVPLKPAGNTYKCKDCEYTCSVTECDSTEKGYETGNKTCVSMDANGKVLRTDIYACEIKTCYAPTCPTTTTEATTTTTTEATTTTTEATTTTQATTTPEEGSIDCSKCDFTQGQIWRPDVNCHAFWVCEPTIERGVYRKTRMTCGKLYWNQDLHTCTLSPTGNCDASKDPYSTVKPKTTSRVPVCPYETNPADAHQFRSKSLVEYQTCPAGLIFNDDVAVCSCVRGSDFTNKPCKSDMLLHFPYDKHLNDVTCNHAVSVQVGDGLVVLVDDAIRGKVAKFNGKGYLEVPFIRTFFAGNTVTAFSISMFFKATSVSSKGVVVSNGDCEEKSSYEAGYNAGSVYHEGKTTNARVASTGDAVVSSNTWNHVAWVFDGKTLKYYLNGQQVSSKPLTGAISNNDVPMDVGAKCGEFYHTGLIDEVQVYSRALSASEVLDLSKQ